MTRDTSIKLAGRMRLVPMPYGYYLVGAGLERKVVVGGTAEDRQCLAQLLKRGTRIADLDFIFHDLDPYQTILEKGLEAGWLCATSVTVPYRVTGFGGKSLLQLGAGSALARAVTAAEGSSLADDAAELQLDLAEAAFSQRIDEHGVQRVLYFADGCGWRGLSLLQELLLPRYPVLAAFGLGPELVLLESTPEATTCLECLLRWAVGNSSAPAERTRWLRFLISEGESPIDELPGELSPKLLALFERFAAGNDKPTGTTVVELTRARLRRVGAVAAHPSCTRSHGSASSAEIVAVKAPRNEGSAELFRRRASALGIVRDFRLEQLGDASAPYYLARAAINTYFHARASSTMFCFGDAPDPDAATFKCIGEAAERISLFHYNPQSFRCARYSELEAESLPASQFVPYSSEQYRAPAFPFAPFDPDAAYLWTRMKNLETGADSWIPAEFVYAGCRRRTPPLFHCSSVGSAAHSRSDRAVLSALFETVERDALSLSFLARLPLPQIPAHELRAVREEREALERDGFEVFFLDLTLDIAVPAALVIAFRPQGPAPYLLKGAAGALARDEAVQRGMSEVWRSFLFYRKWPDQVLTDVRRADPSTAVYNLALYQTPNAKTDLGFLIGHDCAPARPVLRDMHDVVSAFRAAGLAVFSRDCTPAPALALGLECARVFVPGAVPTALGQSPWCLGSPRIYTIAQKLGLRSGPIPASEINDRRHFFS